jgi:hypothetical protein
MAVIKVPKTPRKAYDTNRPAGDLLKRQVEHLEWAIRPASQRSPEQMHLQMPKTEGEAAAQIAKLTEKLHQVSAAAPSTLPAQAPAAVQARAAEKARVRPSAGVEESVRPATPARRATRAAASGRKKSAGGRGAVKSRRRPAARKKR